MSLENYHSSIARIENIFLFNAKYQLTAREQKILLYLICTVDPKGKKLEVQLVPIKDLSNLIITKRSGSFYEEMTALSERLVSKRIKFDTQVKIKGRQMQGFINWFQSIIPVYNKRGEICLKFKFSSDLQPFLLELNEYTRINYSEILSFHSSFSIRMYQVFRAHRNKISKHRKKSTLIYELEDLKSFLGIESKYKDWRNFNKYVVKVINRDINELTSLDLKITLKKRGRKIVGLQFEVWDSCLVKKQNTTVKQNITAEKKKGAEEQQKVGVKDKLDQQVLERLTYAELRAVNLLIEYGVRHVIALKMLSRVGGSEIKGFEDWYFEIVLSLFNSKTNQTDASIKAATLVHWFLKKKVFEQGDHFARIMERLQVRKKTTQRERSKAWDNRLLAKEMTWRAFGKSQKKQVNAVTQ